MVSHEAADVFVYDALSNDAIRRFLLDRKVESRQAYVEGYQLGKTGEADLTLLEGEETPLGGKGITVGEIFRLYPEGETDLVEQFMNRPRRQSLKYELVPFQVKEANPSHVKAESVIVDVLTPLIVVTNLAIKRLDPLAYGVIRRKEMRPLFQAARMVRANYLTSPTPQPMGFI